MQDKIIVVSGGAKGIGLGIAELLSREGAIPIIVGRNEFFIIIFYKVRYIIPLFIHVNARLFSARFTKTDQFHFFC